LYKEMGPDILRSMIRPGRHLLSSILVVGAFVVPAGAQTMFPTDGLEGRIEFWKQVFTKYGADEVIVHDRIQVNLIYAVATDETADDTIRSVREGLREIRDQLSTPDQLSARASEIRQDIVSAGLQPSQPLLDRLWDDVHTQLGVKERFRSGVIRSGRYLDSFQKIMEDHGTPAALALLPLVESSYENARSSAAAVGVWQFTRPTARDYLRVNRTVDERLDPMKSANAAAKLLKDNYDALGTWPLAITAYNHGRGGMLRAKSEQGSDLPTIINEYDGPLFGYASMNFYTEFLAAIDVYEHRQDYFGTLALDRPSGPTPTPAPTLVKVAAKEKTPVATRAEKIASTAKPTPPRATSYTVRPGDTLSEIAQRFRTSIRQLTAKNKLAGHSIYAGQILIIR
jgi:membrane-bound lytic murein transglycosylase D